MISRLAKMGIEPQAVEQLLDMTIPESKIMLAIYLAAPEVENDRRSLNAIAGMRKAMKEGRHVNMAPRATAMQEMRTIIQSLNPVRMLPLFNGCLRKQPGVFTMFGDLERG